MHLHTGRVTEASSVHTGAPAWTNLFHANRKMNIAILISDEIYFKLKTVKNDKVYYISIKQ